MRGPCFECGEESTYDHHVVPASRGGTSTVPLCADCHAKAHHRNGSMTTAALTRDALQRKRSRGEKTGGDAPYGWRKDPESNKLMQHRPEQRMIRIARRLRSAGLSLRRVGAELEAAGLHPRLGGRWHAQSVKHLLSARLAASAPRHSQS